MEGPPGALERAGRPSPTLADLRSGYTLRRNLAALPRKGSTLVQLPPRGGLMPRAPWPSSQRPRANIPASPPLGTMPKTLTVPLAVAVARLAAPRDEKARATTSPPPGSARACSPERSFHSLIARSCEAVASTSPFSPMARSRHGPVCPLNESAGLSSAGAPEPDGSWKASLAAGRRHHDHRTGAHAAEAHPVQLTRLGPCVEHRGARAVGHAPHPRTAVSGGGRQQLAIAREVDSQHRARVCRQRHQTLARPAPQPRSAVSVADRQQWLTRR